MDLTGLSIVNARASKLPGPNLLHQLVKTNIQHVALEYMGNGQRSTLTYSQMHEAASSLAIRITKASGNVQGQFVVPVLIHQSPLLYISLLAVLKAGGAFCPLNIDAPSERVKFILGDVAAKVVLVTKELASEIPNDIEATVIVVDDNEQESVLPQSSVTEPHHRVPQPEDLAYVMYTSGSTGTPKGVGISHDAATQALIAHDRHIPSFSRFLQFAAPTFDVSVFEIFFPLFRGVTLVSVRRVEMLDDLPGVLRTMNVDACELTPTVAGSLLRKRSNAPELKVLLTIGEMLNAPVVEEFGGDGARPSMLWAMYGPTEATIHCTLQAAFSSDSSTGNIGVPLDTVSCFVIEIPESDNGQYAIKILPQGEVGELAVGGYQLASGYINRPEQTNSAFIDSPFGRIYRTGDKARLLPNGRLECLGRISDGQVKLRGQRLELGEVEQAVLRATGCHSAVAAVVGSILVVFCAVDAGVTEDTILSYCGNWLPQYMIPGEIILMPDFPRLPSGKVDRKRLKVEYEENKAHMSEGTVNSEPLDQIESELLSVVSRALNFKVDKSMSLASLGMDSLKAIKLASALRVAGFEMESTALLILKTVAEVIFAARKQVQNQTAVSQSNSKDLSLDLAQILQQNAALASLDGSIEDVTPCTPLQAAMLAETAQHASAYCNEIELSIPSDYTVDQVTETFKELSHRHPILRTGFTVVAGKFVTLIHRNLRSEQIRVVDKFDNGLSFISSPEFCPPLILQIQRDSATDHSRILLQLHHSLYDGWSMDILLADWSKLLLKETVSQHPPFRKVVGFYHLLQNDDAARVFWTEHFVGWKRTPLPKLQGKVGHSNQTMCVRRPLALSRNQVDAGTQRFGCSPQVVFQAALALLWSGITGTRDITIGSVTSGRTISVAGIEDIVGPCIASLPVRIDLDKTTASLDLLNSIHSSNRKIMQYCTVSLSEIKKLIELQPGESLYDVLFVYQESLTSSERTKNVVKEVSHLDRLETPVLFEVEPTENGFALQVTYHEAFISPKVAENITNQFESLILSVLKSPDKEIKWISRGINGCPSIHNLTPTLPQHTPDLAQLFEDVVRKCPASDALLFTHSLESGFQTNWSFQELNGVANQIARYLQSHGVRVGQVVAILMDKSPMFYASILGIMKSGCGYLPILLSTPAARTQEILVQAETKHCLMDAESLGQHTLASEVSMIPIDIDLISNLPATNLDIGADGARLAYVIYTSGTTGTPKGVAVQQQNIAANIVHLEAVYPKSCCQQGRLLQACSQAFDVSVFEIFYTWYAGMCLCVGTNDTIFGDIERSIRDLKITHLSMTPTVATLVEPSNVPGVEFLVTAGEPMTQSVYEKWQHQLWQGYGPSETTNICTVKKMTSDDHIEHLGHAFPNTSVVVLCPDSTDAVPLNWVGEFCFGGAQVAQGYLNMPELTAQKFIQHPRYGRLYRSGDMGRMLPDGSLVILGRIDDQVKLRGQRIEIGEINSAVTMTGQAASAVTLLVQREETYPQQLALFYVPHHDPGEFKALEINDETHQSLVAHLQSRLPGYMVPSYLIPISSVPMTSSGKIDKHRLRGCFNTLKQDYLEASSKVSPATQDEGDWGKTDTTIADAIVESAKVSPNEFGRYTPFTLLGIDSISAIDLARLLNSKLKTRVAVSDILRNPTIAQLSQCVNEKSEQGDDAPTNSSHQFFPEAFTNLMEDTFMSDSRTIKAVLPCTPLQEAMLSRGQRGYYNKVLLRLSTPSQAMKSYWKSMTNRHDILRTCFVTTTDSHRAIAQIVLNDWEMPWQVFDVNELSFDGTIEEHLRTLPDPVDSRIPPVSLALLRYRGSEFISFICHHALYDGVAMERLLKEVEALARGEELPPPVPYSEFLRLSTSLPDDVEQFWQHHFQDFVPSAIFAQTTTSEIDQSTCTTSMDLPLTDLQARLRSLGITLLSVCQASWATALTMAYRRSDVCFGNVVSGRTLDIEGLDKLVAPCFNTIPLRVDFPSTSSNIDMVKHLQNVNTEMLAYQFTPLRLIQRSINRTGKHIFDTLLLLQKPLQDIDKGVWTLEGDSGDMDIPLVCEIVPCPGLNSLVVNLHRDMSIVTEEVATAMADIFKLTLRTILMAPHAMSRSKDDLSATLRSTLEQLEPRHEKEDNTASSVEKKEEWSQFELQVRGVLVTLSGVPEQQIRRHTTIFQLGLDSINAVQVASILRKSGFVISASDVIECPSCSKIAAKLLEKSSNSKTEDIQKYDLDHFSRHVATEIMDHLPESAKIEAILPCTPVQSAMLASFIQSGGENYLNAVRYMITEDTTMESLATAWRLLQERHPMLRTGFVPVQHLDTSFAMVRHAPGSMETPLRMIQDNREKRANLLQFKADVSREILSSLHQPPWTVLVVQTPECTTMDLVAHHALYDAPTLHMMLGELSQLVEGKKLTESLSIEPALSVILGNLFNDKSSEKAFWEAKASSTVVNKFPIMTPLRVEQREVLSDAAIASLSFSELKKATQASNVTIQAAIQAAWTRVLASYVGENSVVFGVALSGRTVDETRDAAFPCLNTVPIVASNVPSNADLVNYMMDYNQHLHKHQFSPLSQVQKWLGHSSGPIFDTLLAYQKMPDTESSSTIWKVLDEEAKVEYPVSLEIEPVAMDQVRLCMTYHNDILPSEQAQLLMKQFDASLSHIVCNAAGTEDDVMQHSLALYSVLPASKPALDAPVELLHQFVERGAAVHPQKLALEFVSAFDGDNCVKEQWSYHELNVMGNKVANMLHDKVIPGSIVAVHFDKCPEAYFSILGILKAGCSFVVLDPSAPKARKEFIIEDSQAPCLLTKHSKDLDFEAKTALFEVTTEALNASSEERLMFQPTASPTATCYCLYTSGTTGTPKGCEITHDNAVQAMMAFQDLFKGHWDDESRWLQFAALHFDVSVLEQYWSWSVGMAVVAAPKDLILDDLTASINRLGITHIDLTPSLARLTHPDEIPSLCRGVFITGGEQLKQEILDVWGPKAVIYNAYGPTEATIGVTMFQRVPINGRPSNIGKQFPNVGSFVFKQNTNTPVFRGGVGELCVSGRLVGKGYLNRPELTEERFPVLAEFSERVYRTGDLVRVLHDGCFDFLGRADDQVKLRGQRLEIAEINHVIRTDVADIQDAATIVARHGTSGKDVLVTFVVSQQPDKGQLQILLDQGGLTAQAKEACRAKLPGYMVPTYIFSLSYIPLSSNNKAEIKDLKRLFGELAPEKLMELSSAATVPTSQGAQKIMSRLLEIISQFSDIRRSEISSSTSIFDVGVDSITALRLSSLLKSVGLEAASPAALLKNPVIGDLANFLAKVASTNQEKFVKDVKQSIQAFDLMMKRIAEGYDGIQSPHAPSFFEALSRGPLARYENCRGFWESHLKGWSSAPIKQIRDAATGSAFTVEREISITNLEAIRSSQNVTLQAVVMSLWASVLQNFARSHLTMGVVVSGRAIDLPGVESTIGPLFNTIPFYCRTAQRQTWKSFVRQCHDFNASVLDFQHVSLKDIQKWCSRGKALFDNIFTYQIETASINTENVPFDIADSYAAADYPLAFEAVYTLSGTLRLALVAQGHVASAVDLNSILDEFERCAYLASQSPESEVPVPDFRESDAGALHPEPDSTHNRSNFEWTQEAQTIQNEIALLADAALTDIAYDTSILELGLDSIDVIKLSAKLKKHSIHLAPSQIMRHQTISNMLIDLGGFALKSPGSAEGSTTLKAQTKLRELLVASGIDMANVETVLPSTHLQESMIVGMIQSEYDSYFNHDILRVADDVVTTELIKAWTELVSRTPILRTGFFQIDDHESDVTYCQVVSRSVDINFEATTIENPSELRQVTAEANEMAKCGRGEKYLFQLRLVNMGPERYVVLSMAHALYDGWSLGLIYQDLHSILEGRPFSRPPVEPFISRVLDSTNSKAQEFWMQYLEGASPSIVPTQETFLPVNDNTLQRHESTSRIALSKIESTCKRLSISMQSLCQACWAITLARQIKTLDVVFGTVMSGRDFDGAEKMVFPTMNTVALRGILHGSVSEFLRYLEDNMNDIRDFQHYPLRKAQTATKVDAQGLFNTLFILQKSLNTAETSDRTILTSIEGSSATEYPVCVEAEVMYNTLVWRLAFQPQLHWNGPPEGILESLDCALSFLVRPDDPELLLFEENGVSICGMPAFIEADGVGSEPIPPTAPFLDVDMEWTPVEAGIRDILHQISGIPLSSIKVSDNLYHLGLDSISAIKVSSNLRKAGINLRPQDLVKSSSISEMARQVRKEEKTPPQALGLVGEWEPPKDINVEELLSANGIADDHADLLPALPMQIYMLKAWQKAEGSVFFPEFSCQINTSAELEDIRGAWDRFVSETPILRTCFIPTPSETVPVIQAILKHHRIPLLVLNAEDLLGDHVRPLVTASISQHNEHSWFMRLRIHHALYDGVSLTALLRRFSLLLEGAATVNNEGFTHWKQFTVGQATVSALNKRREFWTTYLQGPCFSPRFIESEVEVGKRVSHFDKSAISNINQIQAVATQSGVSIQSLFLAAYARVVAAQDDLSDGRSVVFGIYLANRAAANDGLPHTYPTLNLVPLKVDSPAGRSLLDIAGNIQRDIHQITSEGRSNVGFWEIARWTGIQITSFVNFLSLPNDTDAAQDPITPLPEKDFDGIGDDHVPIQHQQALRERSIIKDDMPVSSCT
ncbi:Non-ribosomal peptide synthetase [Fusarium acuminatum]|uniref:Non-ribosomal peptide synthetase n=1 Tax=Fusarium acuminatum TaxID=5515 RepID=A0ABZ2WLC5_9HYPO